MRYVYPDGRYICIGHQADNETLVVPFPEYENFTALVNIIRPGDDTCYAHTMTLTEKGWEWTVTNTDVEYDGNGVAQVQYLDGEGAVCMSVKYKLIIESSIVPTGEVPDPLESWYQDMLDASDAARRSAESAAEEAEQAAESATIAQGHAGDAEGYADDAKTSAEGAETFERAAAAYAAEAAENAQNAQTSAQTAESAKTLAQTAASSASESATEAANSASAAAASAQTAEEKADAILDLTVTAKGLPEGSTPTAERSIVGEHYNIDFGIPAGATGAKGDKGDAGFSPTATVTQSGDITTIEVTDEQGTTSAEIDLSDYMRKEDAWALLPTDTASGAVASFPDGADDVPMISLVTNVEPVQDLHGYDSPWPAGGGKNKFNPSSILIGTYNENTNVWVIPNATTGKALDATFEANTQYTFSGTATQTVESKNVRLQIVYTDNTTANLWATNATTPTAFSVTSAKSISEIRMTFGSAGGGVNIDHLQIESGITATAWTPYSNICPISGWSAAEVNVNGKTITHEFVDELGNTLTVYGGEDELVGGKLRVTHGVAVFDGSEAYNGNYFPTIVCTKAFETGSGTRLDFQCSHSPVTNLNYANVQNRTFQFSNAETFWGASNVDEFKALLAEWNAEGKPLQIVYPLAEPLEYDLSREELTTLLGDNTIFADCGDVEVTYKADIAKWVEKKLGS